MSQPYTSELQQVIRNYNSLLKISHLPQKNLQEHNPFTCPYCSAIELYEKRYAWLLLGIERD